MHTDPNENISHLQVKLSKTAPAVKSKLLRERRAKQLLKSRELSKKKPSGLASSRAVEPKPRKISKRIQRAIAKTHPEKKDTLFKEK